MSSKVTAFLKLVKLVKHQDELQRRYSTPDFTSKAYLQLLSTKLSLCHQTLTYVHNIKPHHLPHVLRIQPIETYYISDLWKYLNEVKYRVQYIILSYPTV